MKNSILTLIFSSLLINICLGYSNPNEDENDFSLEGVLELFQDSENLEDFETKLNQEDNYISNLDLNEDDKIDYIKVIDIQSDNVHAIVLQIDVDENESQDIAVIEIEKSGEATAHIQIVGDEDIFGEDVIVEPFEVESSQGQDGGPSSEEAFVKIVINVWGWPCVRYVYHPTYRVYRSPWRWGYYPSYWRPWRPHPFNILVTKRPFYRLNCHTVTHRRFVGAHKVYKPRRTHSVTVKKRHSKTVVVNKNRRTKTVKTKTTTVKNKNGKTGVKRKTTATKTKKTRNGKVKSGKRTKTTKVKRKKKN
ncbi:MAG: hypothetical protein HKO66_12595 [Saprospiraceae bacterium]|nr:hypothetical protein [Bacteroidia bacterium]NNE13555.1 hypothetical protein [Saprospiraceae bacterium]NNL93069.1 hypothetical protein [Saprospiraceae bacterium]